jgi:hypothetical protein
MRIRLATEVTENTGFRRHELPPVVTPVMSNLLLGVLCGSIFGVNKKLRSFL